MSDTAPLPDGWEIRHSKSNGGKAYYFHPETKKSQWEKPSKKRSAPESSEPKNPPKRSGPTKVRCSHILRKHAGSRRPFSWRQEEQITISEEEAIKQIKELRAAVVGQERTFAECAKVESDCSSAKNGGDLGSFRRGKMQPKFEDAAFALSIGQMSEPVSTDSGIHIIIRTE
eukprot:m.14515 g.14515  ORF g.14515 m.14515 type:complete len:172 (+) comp5118_c0_seq1:258-773(+)